MEGLNIQSESIPNKPGLQPRWGGMRAAIAPSNPMKLTTLTMTGLVMLGGMAPVLAHETGKKTKASAAKKCPVKAECKAQAASSSDAQEVEIREIRSENGVLKVRTRGKASTTDKKAAAAKCDCEKAGAKNGRARLELKVAPKHAQFEKLRGELKGAFSEKGVDREKLEKALKRIHGSGDLGHAKVHGFVVGPDGVKHELKLGDGVELKKKLRKKLEEGGGAERELKGAAREGIQGLLGEVLGNPETLKRLGEAAGRPEIGGLLGEALKDPALQGLLQRGLGESKAPDFLQRGLNNPEAMKMLEQGLNSPELRKMMEEAMKSEQAQEMMKRFLGGGLELEEPKGKTEDKPKAERKGKAKGEPKVKGDLRPAERSAAPAKESKEEKKRRRAQAKEGKKKGDAVPSEDAEIRALKKELKEQRALLQEILEQLQK